jgi:hypothetical protein
MIDGKIELTDFIGRQGQEMTALLNLLADTLPSYASEHPEPLMAMVTMLATLPYYAGCTYASLVANGLMNGDMQPKLEEAAALNFAQGVKEGLQRARDHALANGSSDAIQ